MHPINLELDKDMHVLIDYTNYRGELKTYKILPHSIAFTKTEFHPERQWMLQATDVTRNVMRQFAMKDMHLWCITS